MIIKSLIIVKVTLLAPKAAGYAFSPAILEDIIVCACIEGKVYDIADINDLLFEYNAKPFAIKEDA